LSKSLSEINGRITDDKQDKDNKNVFFDHDFPRQVRIPVSQLETTNINFRSYYSKGAFLYINE